MEGSTMSPPPASPTEGEDPCEIDVTNVAIRIVTLLIGLCGLAGNWAVIWVVGFHLRVKPITAYTLDLAVINFLFLLAVVPSTLLFLLEDVSCSAVVPPAYTSFLFLLFVLFYNVGLYRLTAISVERCRSMLCQLCCHCNLPQKLSWVVVSALLWALSIAVMAVIATVTSLCWSHEQEQCRVALISMYTLNLFIFAPSVVIAGTILFIHFKCGSQQQQHKRLDIIVFLVVLFTLPLSLWNFLQQLGYTVVSSQVVFLFSCIHSSINPFIYFSVTNCWRQHSMKSLRKSFKSVFEGPEENTPSSNDVSRNTLI